MTRTKDITTIIREFVDERVHRVRVAVPGVVEAYDATKQVADIAIQVQERIEDDDGEVTCLAPPVIPDVPIAFPRSGNWFFSVPIAKGDSGMVIMCDRSIDQWRAKGKESPNVDGRYHDLSDAVFYPGLVPMGRELSSAIDQDLVIGDDANPSSQIRVKAGGGGVVIGDESAAKAVAIAEKVEAQLTAIKDAIANAVPGAADGGAGFKRLLLQPS